MLKFYLLGRILSGLCWREPTSAPRLNFSDTIMMKRTAHGKDWNFRK